MASGREILRGVTRYVREHEPWAVFYEARGLEESVPQWVRRWKGDGIIARVQNRIIARELKACRIPIVDVLGVVPNLHFPLVHVDDAAIGRMAAAHLIERGFRRFGFFGIDDENWSERRFAAFRSAVSRIQADVPIFRLPRDTRGRHSWERAENRLAQWISQLPRSAGVMVCSDQRGSQFLEACRRAERAVPEDLAVISVDNDELLCDVCTPPLSSVDAGHFRVGYEAAARLDRMLHGEASDRDSLRLQPREVVVRRSSDVSAISDPVMGKVLRLIRERAAQGIRIDDLAQQVGLSRSVLQRRFRVQVNRTIHQELLRVRVAYAQELLTKTALPVALIAERAGFRHQEYLGAVFRERLGKTPAQVRNEGFLLSSQRVRPTH